MLASFQALAQYNQFIIWKRIVHNSGKIDKVPQDYRTLLNGDPHDPELWLTFQDATAIVQGLGDPYGVGFVFTTNDPFFFIDLDHGYDPATNTWLPHHLEIINQFQGACMEWSTSGTGAHIFGTFESLQENRKIQNDPLGVAVYTSKRFVALTFNELFPGTGDSGKANLEGLRTLVDKYLTKSDSDTHSLTEWTTEPITPGTGLSDPNQVLEVLMRMKSGSTMFDTNHASPADLWNCNEDVLSQAYPSLNDHDAFDRSSADMGLASHLSFVTGGNCELIQNMMFMSGLNRDKWHDRPGWLQDTILKAVSGTNKFYTGQQNAIAVTTSVLLPPTDDTAAPLVGVGLMPVTQQIEHFKGCAYITDRHRVFVPNGMLVKPEAFKSTYGGYSFLVTDGKSTKNAFEAFTENQLHKFPKVDTTCFRPDLPAGEILKDYDGDQAVNIFIPKYGKRVSGDASPMYNHIARILPVEEDQRIFISWQAALVQYPGLKIPWAIVLQGVEGNGKSFFYRAFEYILGRRYCHKLDAKDLSSVFNSWISQRLLIGCEEIRVGGRLDVANALKPLITDDRVHCQAKGQDQVTVDNIANFLLCSNYKDAVLKSINDRRYAVFYTAQQDKDDMIMYGMDDSTSYFTDLYSWLDNGGNAIWAHELSTYPISVNLKGRAPLTSSTEEAIVESGGIAEHILREAIEAEIPGFTGGLIDVQDATEHLAANGKKFSPRKVSEILRNLNYEIHPALKLNHGARVKIKGIKRRIFVKRQSLVRNLETPTAVAEKWSQLKIKSLMPAKSG